MGFKENSYNILFILLFFFLKLILQKALDLTN